MGIAAAIVGAGVLAAGASIISSSNASGAAQQASAANNAATLGIYNSNKANSQGFINNGLSASNASNALLGLGGDQTAANNAFSKYQDSTGYKSQLSQGENAVNNNYAMKGALNSGGALKASDTYAQEQVANSFQTYLGNLQSSANTGLSATNALAGVGTNVSGQIASSNNNAASAAGSASIAQGNAISQGLGSAVNALSSSSYGSGFNANAALAGVGNGLSYNSAAGNAALPSASFGGY
jgi:hypothetical protein